MTPEPDADFSRDPRAWTTGLIFRVSDAGQAELAFLLPDGFDSARMRAFFMNEDPEGLAKRVWDYLTSAAHDGPKASGPAKFSMPGGPDDIRRPFDPDAAVGTLC